MEYKQPNQERYGLSIKDTRYALGDVSAQTIYNLINLRELNTFKIGRRRFVTPESINAYRKRHMA